MKVKAKFSTKSLGFIQENSDSEIPLKTICKNVELKKWDKPQVIFLSTLITLAGGSGVDDFAGGLNPS